MRFVAGADFDDRSLGCIAEVPQGGLAWFMEGDATSVLDATDARLRATRSPRSTGTPPLGLLAFDCIARRGVLGDEGIAAEVEPRRRARRRRAGRRLLHLRRDRPHARDQRLPQPDARRPGGQLTACPPATAGRPSSSPSSSPPSRRSRTSERPRASAVERAAEALEAEVARGRPGGAVAASVGFPAGRAPHAELLAAAAGELPTSTSRASAACARRRLARGRRGRRSARRPRRRRALHAARSSACCAAWPACCALTVRLIRGLDSLRERQRLLEQSSQIQRAIARRAPLHEVLEAIATPPRELLGDDSPRCAWSIPTTRPRCSRVAASGVEPELLAQIERSLVGEGAGGRAIAEDRLVLIEDYSEHAERASSRSPSTACSRDGRAGARARATVVGSLDRRLLRSGRTYSEAEQEMLLAFAEHASLALTDAKTVDAMLHQALHDALTGLPNRALFLDRLAARACALRERTARRSRALPRPRPLQDRQRHASATPPATSCSSRSPSGCGRACGRPTPSRGSAATSSPSCSRTSTPSSDAGRAGRADPRGAARAAAARRPRGRRHAPASASPSPTATATEDAAARRRHRDVPRQGRRRAARYEFFEPSMRRGACIERLELEDDLRRALDARRARACTTSRSSTCATGTCHGVEALVRWQHPERGLRPARRRSSRSPRRPASIVAIGALGAARGLPPAAPTGRRDSGRSACSTIGVNLSPRQLSSPTSSTTSPRALERARARPTASCSRSPRRACMRRHRRDAASRCAALQALGVRLAIDDFGTGYSSLQLPARASRSTCSRSRSSFVDGLAAGATRTRRSRARSSQLGDTLGLDVVAEGVETAEQLEALRQLGCRLAQGYFFARPQAPEQLEAIFAAEPACSAESVLVAVCRPSPRPRRRRPRAGALR